MNRTWIHIGNKWLNLKHVAEFSDGQRVPIRMDSVERCLIITMMTHYIDGTAGYPIEHEFFGTERESLLEWLNGNHLRAVDLTAPAEPHDEEISEAYTDYDIYMERDK